MKMLLSFKDAEGEESASCPSPEDMRQHLATYHHSLIDRLAAKPQERGKIFWGPQFYHLLETGF